jgi:hypothetical protein
LFRDYCIAKTKILLGDVLGKFESKEFESERFSKEGKELLESVIVRLKEKINKKNVIIFIINKIIKLFQKG